MSELRTYIGISSENRRLRVADDGINRLIQSMGSSCRNDEQISGIHRVPCIITGETDNSIVHPVLGARGKSYAGFKYTDRKLLISAQRTADNRPWTPWNWEGRHDLLTITMATDNETDQEGLIGIPVYYPEEISNETEILVGQELSRNLGYSALHMDFSSARLRGSRELVLSGENTADEAVSLPFITEAARILTEQVAFVLQKDLKLANQ